MLLLLPIYTIELCPWFLLTLCQAPTYNSAAPHFLSSCERHPQCDLFSLLASWSLTHATWTLGIIHRHLSLVSAITPVEKCIYSVPSLSWPLPPSVSQSSQKSHVGTSAISVALLIPHWAAVCSVRLHDHYLNPLHSSCWHHHIGHLVFFQKDGSPFNKTPLL